MPLYTYECPACSSGLVVYKSIAALDREELCPRDGCRRPMQRIIVPSQVVNDYEGYTCPITGNWIEGRTAHRENLARHGCRVLEPGEMDTAKRARAHSEEALLNRIGETVAREIESMSASKRRRLEEELTRGADAVFNRR